MNYITKRAEGSPDWIAPAIKCKVWNKYESAAMSKYIIGTIKSANQLQYLDEEGEEWLHAEPIEAWQPQEGEIVAKWNDCINYFVVRAYKSDDHMSHYARLQYPDGRIIDCACDVEELKCRVGEGNWI